MIMVIICKVVLTKLICHQFLCYTILIVLRKENINKKYLKCQAFTFAD